MKLQAHIPTVSVSARDWRALTVALVSLFGASMLILAIQFGGLLNNPWIDRLRTLPAAHPYISAAHRVSLDFHSSSSPIDPAGRFSVAHQLPENVASSQPFSIGSDALASFGVFGDSAQRDMLADEKTMRQLQPNDRLTLMLMLLQLHPHRQ